MLKPFDFLYDFETSRSAGIDANFRTNTGRLSPYDLDNTSQYQLIDEYRNNAYGLSWLQREAAAPPAGSASTRKTGPSARATSTGSWTATTGSSWAASTPSTS